MGNIEAFVEDVEMLLNPEVVAILIGGPHQPGMELLMLENGNEPVRNENYVEEVIPRYGPDEFFAHFRMSRNVMQVSIFKNRF